MHCCYTSLLLALLSTVVLVQHLAALADDSFASASSTGNNVPLDDSKPEVNVEHVTASMTRTQEEERLHERLESSLLNIFGMSQRPRPTGKIIIPQHMIDLYKLQAGIEDDVDIELNRKRIKRHPGNTVRSFYAEEDVGNEALDTEPAVHHTVRLYFNVTHIPNNENLKGAELRLFRRRANDSFFNLQHHQDYIEAHPSINKPHRIDIYEVLRPRTEQSEAITRLIDTRYIKDLSKSKWESFDIHPAVHRWRSKPQANYGIEVHYRETTGDAPTLKHVRLRRSVQSGDDVDWPNEQPLLIAYSDDGRDTKVHSRTKRNASLNNADNVGDDAANDESLTEEERRALRREERRRRKQEARAKKKNKNKCKRHPLYVDFKDVGWSDWIIAPHGYEAFFCHGECPFYLPDKMNTTNHAIVQTLVHSFNPQAAPSPCCVPTELSDIVLLYLDEFEKVTLKNYQDMMVEACGCR